MGVLGGRAHLSGHHAISWTRVDKQLLTKHPRVVQSNRDSNAAIFQVAMVFVAIGLAILKSLKDKTKERRQKFGRMMSERPSRASNPRRSRANTFGNTNQQFEFVE